MDIPAISTPMLTTVAVERVSAPAASSRAATDNPSLNTQGLSRRPSEDTAQTRQAAEPRASRSAALESSRALGPVRFEQEDGTRVAKFFDPKEILIYQVPPEGQLYLVKTGEASSQDQIATSA